MTPKEKILEILKRGVIVKNGICYGLKGYPIKNVNWCGYPIVAVRVGKERINVKIHRIVAYLKYGDEIFNPNLMVRHLDGNKLNFKESNIVLGTDKENKQDIPKEIRIKRAMHMKSFRKVIISDDQVRHIRKVYTKKIKRELAKEYGVSGSYIQKIAKRILRKSVKD